MPKYTIAGPLEAQQLLDSGKWMPLRDAVEVETSDTLRVIDTRTGAVNPDPATLAVQANTAAVQKLVADLSNVPQPAPVLTVDTVSADAPKPSTTT